MGAAGRGHAMRGIGLQLPFVYLVDTEHSSATCEMDGCEEPAYANVVFRGGEDSSELLLCVPHFVRLREMMNHPHGDTPSAIAQ